MTTRGQRAFVTALLACFGCVSYAPATLDEPPLGDERILESPAGAVVCRAALLETDSQSQRFFGFEVSRVRLLPAVLACKSAAPALRVEVEDAKACGAWGRSAVLPIDQVITQARHSMVGPAFATLAFGLVGGIAAGAPIDSANRSIEQDFRAKEFRPRVLNPGDEAFGAIFFRLAQGSERAAAVVISTVDLASGERTEIVVGDGATCPRVGADR